MPTIKRSSAFKRDYRKVKATPRFRDIDSLLVPILELLIVGCGLPPNLSDHPLSGPWKGYRDCHVCPDLILIYQKSEGVIVLHRLGSHSELF
jgi:mRNA interferase YafQ